MIIPGRSWVAGIDMAGLALLADLRPTMGEAEPACPERAKGPKGTDVAAVGLKYAFYTTCLNLGIRSLTIIPTRLPLAVEIPS
jgi:hypothetical protein